MGWFAQQAIADNEGVHFGSHKAMEGVFWCVDDGFTANVEACVHDNRAARLFFKGGDKSVIAWIGFFMHGLNAG